MARRNTPGATHSPGASRRQRFLRLFVRSVAVLAVTYMAYDLFFSEHGYLVYRKEKQQLEALKQEVAALQKQRERLAKEVLRLRNDPKALEALIRRELGYVHRDEFIVIRPEKKKDKIKDSDRRSPATGRDTPS